MPASDRPQRKARWRMSQFNDKNQYGAASYAPPPEKKQHGCFFYGCITLIVITVLAVVAGGIALYMGYRYVINTVIQYSDDKPMELPKVELPEAERKSLDERVNAFKKTLDSGEPGEPLVLTSD